MYLTSHSIDRAKERGIPNYIVKLATDLKSDYSCIELAKNNHKKRIFHIINLEFALFDGQITKYEYSLLKDLCLVLNHDETTLITLYKYTEPNYEKNYEKIA